MDDAPNRIRELRMAAGMSQQRLGDAIGRTKVTISDLERGGMELTLDYMRLISKALGVRPADLLPPSDNDEALSLEERRLIDLFRSADDDQRATIQRVTEAVVPFSAAKKVA